MTSELAASASHYLEASLPNEQGAATRVTCEYSLQKESDQVTSSEVKSCSQEEQNIVSLDGAFDFTSVQPDSDQDMGYSSHSTCSSCQMMDQGPQIDYDRHHQNPLIDWSDVECEDGCHGDDEVEDLIYHFDQYFRGRINSDLKQVQSLMHCMLTEQQIHIRQIINNAIKTSICQQPTTEISTKEITSPSTKKIHLSKDHCDVKSSPIVKTWLQSYTLSNSSYHTGTNSSFLQSPNVKLQYGKEFPSPHIDHLVSVTDGTNKDFSKERLLLHLLSLNCQVNNILQTREYRT